MNSIQFSLKDLILPIKSDHIAELLNIPIRLRRCEVLPNLLIPLELLHEILGRAFLHEDADLEGGKLT